MTPAEPAQLECSQCPAFVWAPESVASGRCHGCRSGPPAMRVAGCHTNAGPVVHTVSDVDTVRAAFPLAHVVGGWGRGAKQVRIVTGVPAHAGRVFLSRCCSTPERAWRYAAQAVRTLGAAGACQVSAKE